MTTLTLGFSRSPFVDDKGVLSREALKTLQDIVNRSNLALTDLGLNPNVAIAGMSKTLGGATKNLSSSGMLPTNSLTGSIGSGQVGFSLDAVPNGTTRFAIVNGANLKGVALVDAANLALINFADTTHQNKILDNINDGVTYQRFTRVAFGQTTLGTGLIASGSSTTATASATGVLATDTIMWNFASAPASGYSASATGSLYVLAYTTANNVNFYIGNSTSAGITPSAQAVNWQVVR